MSPALLISLAAALSPESGVRHVSPDVFDHAPASVKAALAAMGCVIPQTYASEEPHNLIAGQFRDPRHTDWAALCSRAGETSLLLVDSAGGLLQEIVPPRPESDWMQMIDAQGTWGFSWSISAVSAADIRGRWASLGELDPLRIDHDGIDSTFIEKGSTLLYWRDGQWLSLAGSD